jgi:hypothetical protein
MNTQRIERALRDGPPFRDRYVARPLDLPADVPRTDRSSLFGPSLTPVPLIVVLMLLLTLMLATMQLADPDDPAPGPALPADWPLGFVVAGDHGVSIVSPSGTSVLTSDPWYERIAWAFPDGRGGLIFQHVVTPPPWPQEAVLWLRAGTGEPQLLVPESGVWPIGTATSRAGHALFVYLAGEADGPRDRIMVADLDLNGVHREVARLPEGFGFSPGFSDNWIVTGGDAVALVDWSVPACKTVTLVGLDDGVPIPSAPDCLPALWRGNLALGSDGRTLGHWEPMESRFVAIDLATGAVVEDRVVPVPPAADTWARLPVASPGGWSILVAQQEDMLLLDLSGREMIRVPVAEGWTWWFVPPYFHSFQLGPGAALGSGSEELPCRPVAGALSLQELPDPVAATRQLLYDLAASCDYRGLAELAAAHATFVSTDDGCCFSIGREEVDVLARSWVSDGTRGLYMADGEARLPEPLTLLASLLGTTPAYVADVADLPEAQPRPEGDVWVWPAVFVEPSDAAWEELERIVGADTVAALRHWAVTSPGRGGYTAHRIGIADDGTWRFFLAADWSDVPPEEDAPPGDP